MIQQTVQLYRKSFEGLSRPIWLLALITLINRSGTMVIPFMTVYLTAELNFSMAQAGWVMSCFGIGSVLGSYVGGKLTDIIGYHLICTGSLFMSGILFLILMYMDSYYEICLCIFILSIFAEAFRPAMFSAIAIFSTVKNRTRSISLVRLAINLGFAIGPASGGMIAATFGYELLFIADGLTCIGAAIYFYYSIPANVVGKPDGEVIPESKKARSVIQDRPFLVFLIFNLIISLIFMQLIYAVPVYYKQQFLMGEGQIGLLMAMNGILIVVFEMPLVYLCDGKHSNLYFVIVGTFFIGLGYLIFVPLGSWIGVAWLSMLFLTIGEIFKMPFANAFAIGRSNEKNRGAYMGWYSIAFSVSLIASPVMGLQIADQYGFNTLWIVLGIGSALCALGYWLLDRFLSQRVTKESPAVLEY